MTQRRTDNPRFSTAFRRAPLTDRFHMSYSVASPTGCWLWIGTCHSGHGYGLIRNERKTLLAHRVSWELHNGPTTLCVLHKCDNRKCVNPEHLFIGTREENNRDRDQKGRGPRGERNWPAKLKASDIPVIRALYVNGWKQAEIAEKFGVSQGAISGVVNKTTWKHI
jgi:hypothetical protein